MKSLDKRPGFVSLAWALVCLLTLCLFFLASCSSTKKGGDSSSEDSTLVSDEDLALEEGRWADGNIPSAAEGGVFQDIHFDYDSYAVRPEYNSLISQAARTLMDDSSLRVELEGHCDSRGTSEYNLALGEKRAKAVAQALAAHGVSHNQLSTISYGEEIPLDTRPTEEAYAKNRRVHFAVYKQGAAGTGKR